MARKNYTPREKEAYHTNRVNNPHVSDEKKLYSQKWLDGFHDKHAEFTSAAYLMKLNVLKKIKIRREIIKLCFMATKTV